MRTSRIRFVSRETIACVDVSMRALAVAMVVAVGIAAQVPARQSVATGGEVVEFGTGKRVVDARVWLVRRPFPGLPVVLHRHMHLRASDCPSTRTNSLGRFSFSVPVGESVAFCAEHGERMSVVQAPVRAGEFTRVVLNPTREVHGAVHGPGGTGASLPMFCFLPAGGDLGFGRRVPLTTGAKGGYRFRVPLGTWVRFEARGEGFSLSQYVHGVAKKNFSLGPAANGLSGLVLDRRGNPVDQCVVVDRTTPEMQVVTDERGAFHLNRPGAGKWAHVLPPDVHAVTHRFAAKTSTRLVSGRGHAIRCKLVDAKGHDLANALVVTAARSPQDNHPGNPDFAPMLPRQYRTDAAGRVEVFTGRTREYFAAFVETEGSFAWYFRGSPAAGGDVGVIKIEPVGRLAGRVRDVNDQPIVGAAVDLVRLPDDGSPLLKPGRGSFHPAPPLSLIRTTEKGGRFHYSGLQGGRYRLVVRPMGCFPFVRDVQVGRGSEFLRIDLPARRTLSGTVVDKRGRPLAHHRLYAAPSRMPSTEQVLGMSPAAYRWVAVRFGGTVIRGRSDEKGRFRFTGLPRAGVSLCSGEPDVTKAKARKFPGKASTTGIVLRIDTAPAGMGNR